jgi:quercetin dioxygenase-like cupin family protein
MSRHIIVSLNADGSSVADREAGPEFLSADFPPGWQGAGVEGAGLFLFQFDIAPAAVEFPLHADPAEWLAYVISGSGTLFVGTADMEKTEGTAYSAGDFITFRPDTPHGWKSDGAASRILFVKRA